MEGGGPYPREHVQKDSTFFSRRKSEFPSLFSLVDRAVANYSGHPKSNEQPANPSTRLLRVLPLFDAEAIVEHGQLQVFVGKAAPSIRQIDSIDYQVN